MDVRKAVFEALTNAAENGETFIGWTVDEVCVDLATYDSDLEGMEVSELRPHVDAFIAHHS